MHHHHLTCRSCGRSVEVEGQAVEQWAERVAPEAGFTEVGHTVELFGLCPDCAAYFHDREQFWRQSPKNVHDHGWDGRGREG